MTRWTLPPDRIPSAWFNVVPHLPTPPQPPLHPGTREPVGPDDLAPLFPMALIGQEVSAEPWIDVPGEVLDILRLWRPTPLVRAVRLEKALGTPARIYFKDESVSPAGSHKPNTAVPQAFYNARRASPGWPPRPAPASGAPRWRSRAPSSTWTSRSTWCGRPTSRSPTAASPSRPGAARSSRRRSTTRPPRLARRRHLRRRARLRGPRRHPLRARARCSTTCCCTRR